MAAQLQGTDDWGYFPKQISMGWSEIEVVDKLTSKGFLKFMKKYGMALDGYSEAMQKYAKRIFDLCIDHRTKEVALDKFKLFLRESKMPAVFSGYIMAYLIRYTCWTESYLSNVKYIAEHLYKRKIKDWKNEDVEAMLKSLLFEYFKLHRLSWECSGELLNDAEIKCHVDNIFSLRHKIYFQSLHDDFFSKGEREEEDLMWSEKVA